MAASLEAWGRWSFIGLFLCTWTTAQFPDNRCYLEGGGSTESFFVSEDSPVGSVIGALHILGDPTEVVGNIELHLQELDSPILIAPGTKNLTLTRKLDKEGFDGPSSVYVNVVCDRKRTTDPGFVIPVNIRVTDANDNTPQFINAPYVLNISEVTVVGTRVLQGIKAVDADQQGPFSTVQYSVLPGPNSDYFVFLNGLEGTLLLRKPLDYETLPRFNLSIRAQDQGSPPRFSDTTLYVNVIDADDQNPKFLDERYSAQIPQIPLQGTQLKVLPRDIVAYDQDIGINAPVFYSFNSAAPDYRFFEIDRASGHVILQKTVRDDELLQPATLVVRATQVDNPDRYALATLTISRPGMVLGDLSFMQKVFSAKVPENVPLGTVILTAVTNKPHDSRVRFWLEDPKHSGTFSITQNGDLILRQPLDYDNSEHHYTMKVYASDNRMNDSAHLDITVLNVNDLDPRFRYSQYDFSVSSTTVENGDIIGVVEAADGDRGDTVTLSLRGPDARMFQINDKGEISILDVRQLNTSAAHLVAVAKDSGTPPREVCTPINLLSEEEEENKFRAGLSTIVNCPRTASVPVTVHFPEALVRVADKWGPGSTGFLLMSVFGALLGLLGLVIVGLILYIYKHKKHKGSPKMVNYSGSGIQHEKLPPTSGDKVDNPVFGETEDSSNYTATVKSIMSRAGNNRTATQHKVAPAPPQIPVTSMVLSENGKIGWPSGSIPRRVKKLSWDDETSTLSTPKLELDPDVSVTPLTGEQESEQMNLTVYF